jgi:hypothetical protein
MAVTSGMPLIPDLLHAVLSALAHFAPSPDFMDPDVLYLFQRKYGHAFCTNFTSTTLIKRLRDIFLMLRKDFGDGIKYKVVYEERLRLI